MKFPDFKNEKEKLEQGFSFIIGCDEVGVSPLAGPVVAAACIIDPKCIGTYRSKNKWYYRVRDSKTTNEKERDILLQEILPNCLAFGLGEVSPEEIDTINIHHASILAKKKAIEEVLRKIESKAGESDKFFLFVDGLFGIKNLEHPKFHVEQKAVVAGDEKILSISAASIIAKVHRDGILKQYEAKFPDYGFAKHKGYNTKAHRAAILKNGVTDIHRRSFLRNIMAH